MSVRDLTNEELLRWLPDMAPMVTAGQRVAELRRRLLAGEEAERERDRLADRLDAAEQALAEPWTDAALVEKVAQGLFCAAANGDGPTLPFWPSDFWLAEARRVLGEPSEATKLDDGEFGKAVARGGALRLRGSLHGESS